MTNKDFYNSSAKLSLADGFEETTKTMRRLENIMGINIKTQGGYIVKVCKHHFGNIKNELAKEMNKKKIKIKCLDKHGREWLLIDNSLRLNDDNFSPLTSFIYCRFLNLIPPLEGLSYLRPLYWHRNSNCGPNTFLR